VNVPTWAIALLCTLLGALLTLAVKWGWTQKTIAQLEKDIQDLSAVVKDLTAKVNALTIALAEDRAVDKAREAGKHPTITTNGTN
jgi:cell division protein FtsL